MHRPGYAPRPPDQDLHELDAVVLRVSDEARLDHHVHHDLRKYDEGQLEYGGNEQRRGEGDVSMHPQF